jgi:hypothetical protein
MSCRFNKKYETNETKEPKVATITDEDRKPKVIKEPGTTEKPSKKNEKKRLRDGLGCHHFKRVNHN